MKYRIWCDQCLNEYEIVPVNEPTETIEPRVCPVCAEPTAVYYTDDE